MPPEMASVAEINIYEKSTGPCAVCGEESEGSPYWIGMSQKVWLKLKPYLTHLFNEHMVMKTLFIPPYDKPLCGSACAGEYHEALYVLPRETD